MRRHDVERAVILFILTPPIEVVAIAPLVIQAGRLAGHAETVGYVRPANAQRQCLVNERR
jgi:hypothetical protein